MRKAKPYTKADLRLEMKLAKQRIFTEAERDRHAELLEAANRTQDPEEKTALERTRRRCSSAASGVCERACRSAAGSKR